MLSHFLPIDVYAKNGPVTDSISVSNQVQDEGSQTNSNVNLLLFPRSSELLIAMATCMMYTRTMFLSVMVEVGERLVLMA